MVHLGRLFADFCQHFDGKLSLRMTSTSEWTDLVLKFFAEQAVKMKMPVFYDYMLIDQVWRGEHQEIIFALEHEHKGADVNDLLNKEIAHLIDLRAQAKVGIFYPNLGDEKTLIDNISSRISYRALYVPIPNERYMFILGFTTRKMGHPVILFKAYFFDDHGKQIDLQEIVVRQASKLQDFLPRAKNE